MRYDVAAVVVTYNRSNILRQNITCLLAQNYKCDIYIIDNASTDDTREAVNSFTDERVHYFNTGGNLGGAGGFEFGIRQAVRDRYKLLWTMDDDTLPAPSALSELLSGGQGLDWGALSSAVYWTDGAICKANRQKKTLFTFISDSELAGDKPVKIRMASFVSLLVKSEVVIELGLPVGEYFIWTDDYEFTGRISRKHNVFVIPSSKVTHAMKENKKINFAAELPERLERYKYVYRNDVHCYRQFGLEGWLYLFVKSCYTFMNILLNSKENKREKIMVLFRGLKDGLKFRPVIKSVENTMGVGGG